MNIRKTAADVLCEVLRDGRSLTAALETSKRKLSDAKDRGLLQSFCYGTLRWYFRLDVILIQLLRKPIKKGQFEIRVLALLGLYQLAFSRVKPYAAVSETVAAVGHQRWARSFLNAVLRSYQRNREHFDAVADREDQSRTAHPGWLFRELKQSWPDNVEEICMANNSLPPMVLRVNQKKCNRKQYLEILDRVGLKAHPTEFSPDAIHLDQPVDVDRLPEFHRGFVSVQDSAAQLAAQLLDPAPGHRVLDACAAPGGKTAHILEHYPSIKELVAIDIDPKRVIRISENLDRLDLGATILVGDLMDHSAWWNGQLFDRILLDAPCSATGVIRRHPDIKILRRPEDIDFLSETQEKLLGVAWSMLAPGGMLVYSTCSVLPIENHEQIVRFINSHPDAKENIIEKSWGRSCPRGRQTLPGEHGMDGFYYACLSKNK